MHCETILSKSELPDAFNNFLSWVGGTVSGEGNHPRLLPEAKFKRFKQILKTPLDTVEITEAMFTKLNRVLYAEDANRSISFSTEGLEDDFNEFFNPAEYCRTKIVEAVKTSINTVWVADLPEEQRSDYPEPYGYLVDISNVVDINNDPDNNCLWVMFKIKGRSYIKDGKEYSDYIMVYDDYSIRKFESYDGKIGALVAEFVHGLGYTPARMIWTDKLNKDDFINKLSPVTNVLTALDNWLFMSTNKKYMDLGSSYPITAAYQVRGDAPQETNQDNKSGDTKQPLGDDILGPGTLIEVPAPLPGEIDLMSNPIQIIEPSVPSLEYHTKMLIDKKAEIFTAVVGKEDDRTNDQAKNEMQVQSAVESREEVLMRYKKNLEIFEQFMTETLARLRYDSSFDRYDVDYGSEFFLQSLSSLQEDYKEAIESGSDPALLEDIKNQILNYRYRNNPTGRVRADLITDLTPMRDKSIDDLIKLKAVDALDPVDFKIRVNLLDYIARFERENAPLTVWGKELDYKSKLQRIRAELESYVGPMENPPAKSDGELN